MYMFYVTQFRYLNNEKITKYLNKFKFIKRLLIQKHKCDVIKYRNNKYRYWVGSKLRRLIIVVQYGIYVENLSYTKSIIQWKLLL